VKTALPKQDGIERKWYVVDAENKILGRTATKIAIYLRGKHKTCFTPHIDCGDHIIVINTEKIKLTGKKETDKMYYSHSGFKGGLKTTPVSRMREKSPDKLIYKAVYGMLPANKLRAQMLKRLKIYTGPNHENEAQKPITLEI